MTYSYIGSKYHQLTPPQKATPLSNLPTRLVFKCCCGRYQDIPQDIFLAFTSELQFTLDFSHSLTVEPGSYDVTTLCMGLSPPWECEEVLQASGVG